MVRVGNYFAVRRNVYNSAHYLYTTNINMDAIKINVHTKINNTGTVVINVGARESPRGISDNVLD